MPKVLFPMSILLAFLLSATSAAAEVYSRAEAANQSVSPAADAYVVQLIHAGQQKSAGAMRRKIEILINDEGLTWPSRERALMQFAYQARALAPNDALIEVLTELEGYQHQVMVPHEEGRARFHVPMFNVKASARGTRNHWTFESARSAMKSALNGSEASLEAALSGSDETAMNGALQSLQDASLTELKRVVPAMSQWVDRGGAFTRAAGIVAQRLAHAELSARVLTAGEETSGLHLIRVIPQRFESAKAFDLLRLVENDSKLGSAAIVAMGRLIEGEGVRDHLLTHLGNEATGASAALALGRHRQPETRNTLASLASEPGLKGLHAALALKADGSFQARALLKDLNQAGMLSAEVNQEVSKWIAQ